MSRTLLLVCIAFTLSACPRWHRHPHPHDAGPEPTDSGSPPEAGKGQPSAGTGAEDASSPDSGVVVMGDSGPPQDSGFESHDAGNPPSEDAGGDAGSPDSGIQDPDPQDAETLDAATQQDAEILDSSFEEPEAGLDASDPEPVEDAGFDAGIDPEPIEDAGIDAGLDAGVDAGFDAGAEEPPPCVGPPGLYQDDNCQVLAEGVREFTPRFSLWSDGAIKKRWVYLPPGSTISAANPDRWVFPVGTRFYKEFRSRDGALKVETRLFVKLQEGTGINNWDFHAYEWSADQRTATVNDLGATNVHGTGLDIPTRAQCNTCHANGIDPGLGFGAIQLNHPQAGVTLDELLSTGVLVNAAATTVATATIPARNQLEMEAMGYLHANCGHCHGGTTPRGQQDISARVGVPILNQPVFANAVCQPLRVWVGTRQVGGIGPYSLRISGGQAQQSGIPARASQRGNGNQMPPLATNVVDQDGVDTVRAWIDGLDVCP